MFASGKADSFKVYSREGLIFDDLIHPNNQPGTAIDTELYRNSRLLESLEKNFRESHHLLSDKQRLVVQESEKLINDLPPANQVQAKIYLYSGQLAQLQQSQPRPSEPSADVEIERWVSTLFLNTIQPTWLKKSRRRGQVGLGLDGCVECRRSRSGRHGQVRLGGVGAFRLSTRNGNGAAAGLSFQHKNYHQTLILRLFYWWNFTFPILKNNPNCIF